MMGGANNQLAKRPRAPISRALRVAAACGTTEYVSALHCAEESIQTNAAGQLDVL